MNAPRSTIRTLPFWLMFLASLFGVVSSSAATPNLPVYVDEVLGEGPGLSGLLIALADVSALVAMPFCGMLADRFGYRLIAATGAFVASGGLVLIVAVPTVAAAAASRLLVGIGIATAVTLTLTVLVSITAPSQRGRVLSIYGLSVWIGIALGPQVATIVHQALDARAVFAVCIAFELCVGVFFLLLPRRMPGAAESEAASEAVLETVSETEPGAGRGAEPRGLGAAWEAFRAVWVAGAAALAAWCAEGLMLGFLIIHLVSAGVPASGVLGAASVFSVFAASVIIARILLADMPDRIGPLRATTISLAALTAGLAVFAFAPNFLVAALGAVLVGVGFSPLYPSLTMLATRGLRPGNRGLGLGIFGSFTSIGFASGGLLGGIVLSVSSSTWAFVIVAVLQLLALVMVIVFTPDDSPRPRPGIEAPAAPPH